MNPDNSSNNSANNTNNSATGQRAITVYVQDESAEGQTKVYNNIPVDEYSTVLNVLEYIRTHIDDGLIYRCSCHHGSCGTCGMIANDKRVLACLERVGDVKELRIQALSGLKHSSQLVVSPAAMIADFPDRAVTLRPSEVQTSDILEARDSFERMEDCIECGLCMSACPVISTFIGPAPLAAYNREIINRPERRAELLNKIQLDVKACKRHFACTRVCPNKVNPGKKIVELDKMIDEL